MSHETVNTLLLKEIDVLRDELSHEKATRRQYSKDYDARGEIITQLKAENAKLREALEFSVMAIEHAIHLGYVGEGSTLGMFKDALEKAAKAGVTE